VGKKGRGGGVEGRRGKRGGGEEGEGGERRVEEENGVV